MARYRKVYPRLWHDPAFLKLTEGERLLALYVLTGPQTNRVGLFKFSPAQAAEDLDTSPDTFAKRMRNVSDTFLWRFDPTTRTLYIPSWWKWNPPENDKVLIGALADLHEIPQSPFFEDFRNNTTYLSDTYAHTLAERMPIRQPYQEQEQEQEQEHIGGADAPTAELANFDPAGSNGTAVHAFIKAFCDVWKAAHHGATYKVKAAKHVPLVRSLLSTYSHDRLLQLANGLQTVEDDWIAKTDRGLEILSNQVNKLELWCAEEEARYAAR